MYKRSILNTWDDWRYLQYEKKQCKKILEEKILIETETDKSKCINLLVLDRCFRVTWTDHSSLVSMKNYTIASTGTRGANNWNQV